MDGFKGLMLLALVTWIAGKVWRWEKGRQEKEEERRLLKAHPEAFVRLQEINHEKLRMKHEKGRAAAGIIGTIAQMFLRRRLMR